MVGREENISAGKQEHFLDISEEVCPLTFVRVKLLIEAMRPGEVAEIRLAGSEPLANVPRAVSTAGHQVLGLEREVQGVGDALERWRLRIAKR